jgi:hypothetical protein
MKSLLHQENHPRVIRENVLIVSSGYLKGMPYTTLIFYRDVMNAFGVVY